MYDIEKYYQAKDVEDAVRALEEDADAVVISGGSDVLIKIREGKLAGCSLVSIHGIPALEGVRMEADGTIVIGPATTFSHITYDPVIQKYIPALGWAVDQVGGPQIRNIGTIGGNVCNGVTSADSAALLFTLNAVLELTGPKGTREIPVAEFYTGPGRTLREHAEILTAIKITRENYRGFYGHYTKYGKRNAMEIATLGCAVHVKLSADNMRISEFRLGFGVAAPTPIRCFKTEETVKGMAVTDPELYEKIQEGAVSEVTPRSSWRASREFRLQLVRELSVRTAKEAIEKAMEKVAGGEADA
jgi:xanthine dehydrogenase FAD-binding subunit